MPNSPIASAQPARPAGRPERDQSLVEFSLLAIVVTLCIVALGDLGRAYFTYLALADAASEGAFYGAAYPRCLTPASLPGTPPPCQDPNNVVYRVRQSAPPGGLVDWSGAIVDVTAPSNIPGTVIIVKLRYPYQLITPFAGGLLGTQTIYLTAESQAIILGDNVP